MSNLPDWAKGLVSPDIEWGCSKPSLGFEGWIEAFKFYDGDIFRVSQDGKLSIGARNLIGEDFSTEFPSTQHAIHAAETMIRCLRGDALPNTTKEKQ